MADSDLQDEEADAEMIRKGRAELSLGSPMSSG